MQQNPSFRITWAIFTPIKGKFFKKNLNEISKYVHSIGKRIGVNEASAHFGTKEKAIEQINKLQLSKDFEVVFITDFQFGKSKWNESLLKVATSKQLAEKIIIEKSK